MTPATFDYNEDMQARSQDSYSSSILTFVLCVQLGRGGWRNNSIISTRCGDQSLGHTGTQSHSTLVHHPASPSQSKYQLLGFSFHSKNLDQIKAGADCTLTLGGAAPGRSGGSMPSW